MNCLPGMDSKVVDSKVGSLENLFSSWLASDFGNNSLCGRLNAHLLQKLS